MGVLKYQFCFSVKAFIGLSTVDVSVSTSVLLLTRILQHKESCPDVSTSPGKFAKHEFLRLLQKTLDCQFFFIQQMLVLSLCKSCCFHWPCNSLLILGLRFVLPDLGTRIKQFKLTNLARNKLLSKIAILGQDDCLLEVLISTH